MPSSPSPRAVPHSFLCLTVVCASTPLECLPWCHRSLLPSCLHTVSIHTTADEIYGFDLAVDQTGRAWLLEVNSGPDLSLHGERLRADADALLSDVLALTTAHLQLSSSPSDGTVAVLQQTSANTAAPTATVGDVVGGFECVLFRACEPAAELERFKRCMRTVGRFAHSLHQAAGAPVRGAQAQAKAMREAKAALSAGGGLESEGTRQSEPNEH